MKEYKKPHAQIEAEEDERKAIVLKNEMARKWGVDRLMGLVTPELRQRMYKQLQLLAKANANLDYEGISKHNQGYCRGVNALEECALSRGFQPLEPSIWSVSHPKHPEIKILLVQNETMLPTACAMSFNEPNTLYYTVRELLSMIPEERFNTKMQFGKLFPGSTIKEVTPTSQEDIDGVVLHDELVL